MNFSTIVSMTPGVNGPNDTMASSRLRNSGLKTFSIACFDRCCDAFCRTSWTWTVVPDSANPMLPALISREPAFEVMTMAEALRVRTTGLRFVSGLMAGFGVLALVLATVGIYSVMAFYVAQRRHEVGIRMALGATAGDILRLTVGHGARLAALGLVIGLGLGVALARLMESALFGIVAVEPWLFMAITAVLALAALAASLLPARLATKVDPANALRA